MSCDGCPRVLDRRNFLRAALVIGAGTVMGVSWDPSSEAWAGSSTPSLEPKDVRGRVRTYDVPAADGASVDSDGQVILVRYGGTAFAFALSCPHQRTALRYDANKQRFQCPKHKSRYEPNGTFISGRATRSMDRYAISRDGTSIVVDTAVVHKSDTDAGGWSRAAAAL